MKQRIKEYLKSIDSFLEKIIIKKEEPIALKAKKGHQGIIRFKLKKIYGINYDLSISIKNYESNYIDSMKILFADGIRTIYQIIIQEQKINKKPEKLPRELGNIRELGDYLIKFIKDNIKELPHEFTKNL